MKYNYLKAGDLARASDVPMPRVQYYAKTDMIPHVMSIGGKRQFVIADAMILWMANGPAGTKVTKRMADIRKGAGFDIGGCPAEPLPFDAHVAILRAWDVGPDTSGAVDVQIIYDVVWAFLKVCTTISVDPVDVLPAGFWPRDAWLDLCGGQVPFGAYRSRMRAEKLSAVQGGAA